MGQDCLDPALHPVEAKRGFALPLGIEGPFGVVTESFPFVYAGPVKPPLFGDDLAEEAAA